MIRYTVPFSFLPENREPFASKGLPRLCYVYARISLDLFTSPRCSRAVRVFPPEAGVLISFSERVDSKVVGEYIFTVLARAREIAIEVYLKATAASFREAWKMVDTIIAAGGGSTSRTSAEDVVFRMFETNMDEYLDEETEAIKPAFEAARPDVAIRLEAVGFSKWAFRRELKVLDDETQVKLNAKDEELIMKKKDDMLKDAEISRKDIQLAFNSVQLAKKENELDELVNWELDRLRSLEEERQDLLKDQDTAEAYIEKFTSRNYTNGFASSRLP
ncbi:hypothetical protein C8R42DRAFT_639037 [Lentinula raphanica]|nr:hypothetical protein C8R42DRAFT_639037 [Lentinula raphanica]